MKVNWAAAARAQLRDIHTFIARSSPQYAKKIVDRLTHVDRSRSQHSHARAEPFQRQTM
jgi:plasmid stabilization system protein ParE